MTALPSNPTKTNLDASTDDPKQARAELATHVDATVDVIGYLTGLFGSDGTKATALSTVGAYSQSGTKTQIQSQGGIYVATVGGTGDAITLTPSPAISAYSAGQKFTFIAAADNTGSTTVNVSGQGAQTIKKNGGASNLQAGDILTNNLVSVEYDGTNFHLVTGFTVAPAYLGTVSGTDTLTISPSPAHASYVTGRRYMFKSAGANTGAVTLNVNSLGAKTLKKSDGATDLAANDIASGQIVECVYDGTYMQVTSTLAGDTSGGYEVIAGPTDLSGQSSVNLTGIDDSFEFYMIEYQNVITSNRIMFRVRQDGSGTYDSGSSDYRSWRTATGSAASDSEGYITGDTPTSSAPIFGQTYIHDARVSSTTNFQTVIAYEKSGGFFNPWPCLAYRNTAAKIQGVQIKTSSGTFTSGYVTLYGVRGRQGNN